MGHKEETYADLYGCGTGRAPTGKENIRTDETSLYRNRAYFAGTVKGAGKYSRTGAHKCRRDRGGTYRYDQSAVAPEGGMLPEEGRSFTPRARKILGDAQMEAHRFHERLVGTEHILVAIFKDGECVGSRLLTTMGCPGAGYLCGSG